MKLWNHVDLCCKNADEVWNYFRFSNQVWLQHLKWVKESLPLQSFYQLNLEYKQVDRICPYWQWSLSHYHQSELLQDCNLKLFYTSRWSDASTTDQEDWGTHCQQHHELACNVCQNTSSVVTQGDCQMKKNTLKTCSDWWCHRRHQVMWTHRKSCRERVCVIATDTHQGTCGAMVVSDEGEEVRSQGLQGFHCPLHLHVLSEISPLWDE